MKITVGNRELIATLAHNSSAEALKEILKAGPVTIQMRDYGNMEKVGSFERNLPTNDERITTEPGNLILYQGNSFVIYMRRIHGLLHGLERLMVLQGRN